MDEMWWFELTRQFLQESSGVPSLSWVGLASKENIPGGILFPLPTIVVKPNSVCSPPFWISFLDVLVSKTIIQGVFFVSSLNQFCVLHFLCFCSFVNSLLATFFCFHLNFSRIFFSANFSLFSVSRGPHHLRGVQGQPCLEGLPIH